MKRPPLVEIHDPVENGDAGGHDGQGCLNVSQSQRSTESAVDSISNPGKKDMGTRRQGMRTKVRGNHGWEFDSFDNTDNASATQHLVSRYLT